LSFFIISPDIYTWIILPLLIFIAQICNVSLETIRVIYVSKGIKYLAPVIAFFEIVIWLLAIEAILTDISNIAMFLGFAFGFALGTYVGMVIDEKLSVGRVIVRIVTPGKSNEEIISFLEQENYGVTSLDAQGSRGDVKMIISLVNRAEIPRIVEHLKTTNPDAFFSIEDVRYVNQGVFRPWRPGVFTGMIHPFTRPRKKE
jgi:uncharacterized protein YebE (UPF0316 family)